MTISVNEKALEIVEEMMNNADRLDCTVSKQDNGTTIIDAGVEVAGTNELGRLLGEVCLGGYGVVKLSETTIGDMTLPCVIVSTDEPAIATMGSQYAGWVINVDKYFAMGSGPARALYAKEKLYGELEYKDDAKVGVILLETREFPPENVTEHIAKKCGIATSDLYVIVAPTACLAGSIQISARVVEVGAHKLHELKFDPRKIVRGHGTAPIAPVVKKDTKAMGITNDCILYGGSTYYDIRPADGDDLKTLTEKAPSSTSEQYGMPFYDLFKGFEFDFYKVDPLLFSPAQVTIKNIDTGEVYKAGKLNAEVLKQSLGL
ncbi:MAG: methenyltetrahydromethanopterin cyclohydrolase [Candidatus Thorarchaeota archaeon]